MIDKKERSSHSARVQGGLLLAAVASLAMAPVALGQGFNPYVVGQGGQVVNGGASGNNNSRGIVGADGSVSSNGLVDPTDASAGQQNANGYRQIDPSTALQYNPVIIPGAAPTIEPNQTPVSAPTDGRHPGPLYARPLPAPGQFELFQKPPPELNEFEKYVSAQVGEPLPRFGSALLLQQAQGFAVPATATVPPDYPLNAGDTLDIGLTGSVEANLRLVIDSNGKVFIPRIGSVNVAGVRYGDLANAIQRRVDSQFRKVTVSVIVSRLRGLTIYVTGYATSPGAYTVSSLSTMVDAVLSAGGPSAGGSYRTIKLKRGGQLVSTLDLYLLLLGGDKSHDATLQNGDVLNIEPVGPELAVVGSVNEPAIFESKPGETLDDIVRYAGGYNSLADTSRVVVRSLANLDAGGSRQIASSALNSMPATAGDIVNVLSLAKVARPLEREFILATIEGEVDHPGRYFLAPGSRLTDLLTRAGGLSQGAYPYGTVVERETIKVEEQASFDQAISNLQLSAAALPLQASLIEGGPAAATERSKGALEIIDRLKGQRPDGRLILDLAPSATALPVELALENNDRIFVPPRPKTVGVFGAVYRTGSFLFVSGERIGDYLNLAGGPEKIADRNDVFVVRANGSVVSARHTHDFLRQSALPGDVVFVPVRVGASLLDKIVAITAAIGQFGVTGLTLAALKL